MTVEIKPGFILVSEIIDGQLVKGKYIFYTVKGAKKKFKEKYALGRLHKLVA